MAGTETNSDEAPLIDEERKEAKFFIGQYNRGGWMNTDESLKQLDAIEVQLGQGAQASAPMSMSSTPIGEDLRKAKKLQPGEDAVIHSRLPGVNSTDDLVNYSPLTILRCLKWELPNLYETWNFFRRRLTFKSPFTSAFTSSPLFIL